MRSLDAVERSRPLPFASLIILTVALVALVTLSGMPQAAEAALDSEEQAFLTLVNNHRHASGLSPLSLNSELGGAAHWMSKDMATKNYFSHTDSLGRDPFQRMAAFGYDYNTPKGENLAAGTAAAQAAFNLWKGSPGHNANMLNPNFKVIGIARAYSSGSTYGWYWTADFGGKGSTAPPPGAACGGLAATIVGTPGDDVLTGTPGPDVIHGLGGNDVIKGLDGGDVICGGDGNDLLLGGAGNDTLRGNRGRDTLRGGRDWDSLGGGFGDDTLRGDRGRDTLKGDRGWDSLDGGSGNDTADYSGAAYAITASLRADSADGQGKDTLTGIENLIGSGNGDTLIGDGGANILEGRGGGDTLKGNGGHDVLRGENGADTLYGKAGGDRLHGNAGPDKLLGGMDNDVLDGGTGLDACNGGPGTDAKSKCEA